MFAEDNKLLMEENLIQATREIGNTYILGNWSKILVHIELNLGSYSGDFIAIYNDDSFITRNDLFIVSNYLRDDISGLGLGKIANSAYISPKDKVDCPSDIIELEVDFNGNSQINYYEIPLDYTYDGTPELIWQYRKIGYKCRVFWDYEVSSLVKKQNIMPEKVRKNRIKSLNLVDILNNIIKKKAIYLKDFISKDSKNMYFHLDTIFNKKN